MFLRPESLPPQINEEEAKIRQELEEALKLKNFVRAEFLARQLHRPAEEIKELRQKALQQFIVEFRNPEGFLTLAQEYQLSEQELSQFLRQFLSSSSPKQFDLKSMSFLSLSEWVQRHFSKYL